MQTNLWRRVDVLLRMWVRVCVCVCDKARERRHPVATTIFNQTKAEQFVPHTDVFLAVLMLACWLMWTSHIYVSPDGFWQFTTMLFPLSSIPPLFFQKFLIMLGHIYLNVVFLFPAARTSSLLLWGAHDQELPRHSPRRLAQRAPWGRTHRRSVPGCYVHASPTGHSHSRQQPSAGSAHPQRLKMPVCFPANSRLSDQLQHFFFPENTEMCPWTVNSCTRQYIFAFTQVMTHWGSIFLALSIMWNWDWVFWLLRVLFWDDLNCMHMKQNMETHVTYYSDWLRVINKSQLCHIHMY